MTGFRQRQAISTLTAPAVWGFSPLYLVQPDHLIAVSPATGTNYLIIVASIITQNQKKSIADKDESRNFSYMLFMENHRKIYMPNKKSFSGTQANSRPHFSASLATSMQ